MIDSIDNVDDVNECELADDSKGRIDDMNERGDDAIESSYGVKKHKLADDARTKVAMG